MVAYFKSSKRGRTRVTITNVTVQGVEQLNLRLHFDDRRKPLSLSPVQCQQLAELAGTYDFTQWKGYSLELEPKTTEEGTIVTLHAIDVQPIKSKSTEVKFVEPESNGLASGEPKSMDSSFSPSQQRRWELEQPQTSPPTKNQRSISPDEARGNPWLVGAILTLILLVLFGLVYLFENNITIFGIF